MMMLIKCLGVVLVIAATRAASIPLDEDSDMVYLTSPLVVTPVREKRSPFPGRAMMFHGYFANGGHPYQGAPPQGYDRNNGRAYNPQGAMTAFAAGDSVSAGSSYYGGGGGPYDCSNCNGPKKPANGNGYSNGNGNGHSNGNGNGHPNGNGNGHPNGNGNGHSNGNGNGHKNGNGHSNENGNGHSNGNGNGHSNGNGNGHSNGNGNGHPNGNGNGHPNGNGNGHPNGNGNGNGFHHQEEPSDVPNGNGKPSNGNGQNPIEDQGVQGVYSNGNGNGAENEVPQGNGGEETYLPAAEETPKGETLPPAEPTQPAAPEKPKKVPVDDSEEDDDDSFFSHGKGRGRGPYYNSYFPMVFGAFPGGYGGNRGGGNREEGGPSNPGVATAIANSFSTGRGAVATSHATAYGGPQFVPSGYRKNGSRARPH